MPKDSRDRLKQCGVARLPQGWTQTRVKYLGSYINGYPFKPGDWGTVGRPILRIQDLSSSGQMEPNRHDGELPRQYLVRCGDLLISWSGSLGVYRWSGEDAWLNQHIFRVEINRSLIRPEFFPWAAEWFVGEMNREVHGSTMQHLTADAFGGFPLLLPPHVVQCAIAEHLERETARLDALIAAKERVLALLAEKRQAIVARAVTQGLDADAPLRDSGVPWLSKIPAHWETRRVAWLFRERDQRGAPDLPLLEVSISAGVVLREFSDERIESTAADFNSYEVARRGDVAFNKMRMWQGAVGVAPEDGLVSPDYVVAAPTGPLLPEYAGLLFRMPVFSAECAGRSHGIVWDRLRLYWEGFREIELPLPSFGEQWEIVTHLRSETSRLDALRDATQRTVALLRERRAALIAAAVTGQIEIAGNGDT